MEESTSYFPLPPQRNRKASSFLLTTRSPRTALQHQTKRDRRAVELQLTPRGLELARQSMRLADQFNAEALAPLRPAEQDKFMDILTRLAGTHAVARDR